MRKCAFCPAEAEHHLRMEPQSGEGLTAGIAVCSEHMDRVESQVGRLMAAIQGDRFGTVDGYRVVPAPDNVVQLLHGPDGVAAQADITRGAIEDALNWHRTHPGTDHLDAAFATAGFAAQLGESRWPEFVAAVRDVTEASDAFRAGGLEAEPWAEMQQEAER